MTDEVPLSGAPAPEPAATPSQPEPAATAQPPAPAEPGPIWPHPDATAPVAAEPPAVPPAPLVVPPPPPVGAAPESGAPSGFGTPPASGPPPGFGAPPAFGTPPAFGGPPASGPPAEPATAGFTTPGFATPPDVPTSTGFAMGPGPGAPPGYGPPPYGAAPPPYLQPPPPARSRKGLVIGLVAGAVVLVLVCCGGAIALVANSKPSSTGTAAGTGTTATPSSSPSPTATPITASAYASTLATEDQNLTTLMSSFAAATKRDTVQSQAVSLSSELLSAAVKLRGLAPPSDAATANSALANALSDLSQEVTGLGSYGGGDHTLCAGSSAMATLTSSTEAAAVRLAVSGLAAASPDFVFGKFLPAATALGNRRLGNGQQIRKASGGSGQLTAENQGTTDAVVTIATANATSATAVFYVQAGLKATIKGIRDGSYSVYISTGTDWDSNLKEFTIDCKTEVNTNPMQFSTTRSTYSVWTLSFGMASGTGNDELNPVDPGQVPA